MEGLNGLSVFLFNLIKDFIKKNIEGVKDKDIELSLTLLDMLKSGKLNDERSINIEPISYVDVEEDGDITPEATCVDIYPKEAIQFILNKIR